MPIVPVVSPDASQTPEVPSVGVNPMRNYQPQEQIEAGATAERAGLQQTRVAQEFSLRLTDAVNDAAVKAALGKLTAAGTAIHNDYSTKLGADAIDGYDAATQSLAKTKQDIQASLTNDVQRYEFSRIAQQHLVTFGGAMQEHRAQQTRAYLSTEALSRMDSNRSMAQAAQPGSKDQQKYIDSGVAEIPAAYPGAGPDARAKAERAYRSSITQDNVSRLAEDGRYQEANEMITEQQKAGYLEPDTGDRLRRIVRSNLQRTENIDTANSIFAPYQGKDLKADDLTAMLAEVGKIDNVEKREVVEGLVKQQFSEQHSIQQMARRDNLNYVVNYKYSHNGSLKGVDPTKWASLDAKDQYDLTRPEAQETDLSTWYNFITHPETLTTDAVNKAFNTGKLTKGDFKMFTMRAMELQNKPERVQEANAVSDRIDYFANQAGLKIYGQTSDKDKAIHGELTYAVQNEIYRVKSENNGKITADQVDSIIKKELTQKTLNQLRSPWNPMRLFGSDYSTTKKYTFQMPYGTQGTQMGTDGKLHYTDGKGNDLGVAE